MYDADASNTNTDQQPYCPDRRTALETFALAAGGIALNIPTRSPGKARHVRMQRLVIIYELNGGTQQSGQVKYVWRGESVSTSELKKPKRKGYTFAGWYSDARLTRKALLVYGKVRKSKRTVYAKWRLKRYAITYKLNGGTAREKLPASYTIESKRIVFKEPAKRGYRFVGWYADSKFTKKKSSIKAGSTGDVKVYARWECIKYTIDYELNGGKETVALPKSYTVKSSEIIPIVPVKKGWRFAGWYADSGLKERVESIPKGSIGNLKLYADWAPIDYWDEHLQKKCKTVNKRAASIANGLPSLVFITDMHVPTNVMLSPELVRRVMANTNTNMVVFGGDAINKQVSTKEAKRILQYVRKAFGEVEVHFVRGNHDGNRQGKGAKSSKKVSDGVFLSIARHESEVRDGEHIYCYRDDDEHKVRFIFLDSGEPNTHHVDAQQITWLKNRVLELEEGWTVLVFVHQFYRHRVEAEEVTTATYTTSGNRIKTVLDDIYGEARAAIAGVVSGHMHSDYAEYSDKGYPIVSTKCDAYGRGRTDVDYSYKLGSVSEQTFDVISLDTERRMLYFTRVGRGKNRSFSFAPPTSLAEEAHEQNNPIGEDLNPGDLVDGSQTADGTINESQAADDPIDESVTPGDELTGVHIDQNA